MKKDPNLTHWIHDLSMLLPHLVEVLGILLAIGLTGYLIIRLILLFLGRRHLKGQKTVFLELTPHSSNNLGVSANTALVNVWHELSSSRTLIEKLLGQKISLTPERVSTRDQGIRYIMRVPTRVAGTVEQQLNAHSASLLVKRVDDPLPASFDHNKTRILRFKQSGDWAFPFNIQESLTELDSSSYITNALTKLEPGELIAEQLVITPVTLRRASLINNKAIRNEDLLAYLSSHRSFGLKHVFHLVNVIIFGIIDLIGEVTHSSSGSSYGASSAQRSHYDQLQVAKHQKPARTLSVSEQELVDSIRDKVSQPLFRVSMRAVIITDNQAESRARAQAIKSSFAPFTVPQYQSLKTKQELPINKLKKHHHENFRKRLPELLTRKSMILSASEIAALYHFPNSSSTKIENTVQSHSKTLPAPIAIKKHSYDGDFDVVLGVNHYHGNDTDIGLTAAERERHVYVTGGTGNGKTTMLEYAAIQDIRAGKGIALIDPHGDSAKRLLGYIPPERMDDVIYFNPRDYDHPIGLNLLEVREGLTGSELAHEKDTVTEAVLSVFNKIFDNNTDSNAYRIERVLRKAIHTAMTIEGATLFTVLRLLTEASYRKQIAKTLTDNSLKRFWKEELGKAGEMQRVKISSGPVSRIERFENSESAKRVLGQSKSTIDFDDILNSSKILICNFSKGALGEDTSTLFGTTVLARLQIAAYHREDIDEEKRKPFYLYVDEFQNFASDSFMGLFSEARKYKLFMTIAQQSVSQLKDKDMVSNILDNVGSIVCFRSKSPMTEQLMLHQFNSLVDPGEIGNLPSFNFYMKIAAVEALEPLSGETIVPYKEAKSDKVIEKVISNSRKQYTTEYVEPEEMKAESKPNKSESKKVDTKPKVEESPDLEGEDADDLPNLDEPALDTP